MVLRAFCFREGDKALELEGLYRVHIGILGYILGLYRENGKEHGNYYMLFLQGTVRFKQWFGPLAFLGASW